MIFTNPSLKNKKKETTETATELITSRDILIDIFLRFPVKLLRRFKTVCKQWNSIISDDPEFEELHSRRRMQKLRFLFQTRPGDEILICKPQENNSKIEILRRISFSFPDSHLVGSLGPLALFRSNVSVNVLEFTVYDSLSGKQMGFSCDPLRIEDIRKVTLVYDASTKMHKLLVYALDSVHTDSVNTLYIRSFCCRTRQREKEWRIIKASPSSRFSYNMDNFSVKGTLYLLVAAVKRDGMSFIYSFDIAEEKFLDTIMCPENYSYEFGLLPGINLFEIRESLGYMVRTTIEFKIWTLQDSHSSSWIQLHKINLESTFIRSIFPSLTSVFVVENINGMPSILFKRCYTLYRYEMNDGKIKEMDLEQLESKILCLDAWISS